MVSKWLTRQDVIETTRFKHIHVSMLMLKTQTASCNLLQEAVDITNITI